MYYSTGFKLGGAVLQSRAAAANSVRLQPVPSATSIVEGQGVHFAVQGAGVLGVSDAVALRHADFRWDFGADEAYAFASDTPGMRCAADARTALGQYAAHVFVTPGEHAPGLTASLNGREALGLSETITVRAVGDVYAAAATGVLAPGGEGLAGAPAHDQAFTDLDAAMAWVTGASNRRLSIKRGHTYYARSIAYGAPDDGLYIDAWGSGDRPVIRLAPSARFWSTPILDATGDGGQRSWSLTRTIYNDKGEEDAHVFFGNNRTTAGFSWNAAGTEITFAAAPGDGARIRIWAGPPRSRRDYFLRFTQNGANRTRNHVVRDLVFQGDYDPADPGVFDSDDLTTFNHDACWTPFTINNNTDDITIFRCSAVGVRGLIMSNTVEGAGGANVFAVDCACSDWFDYALYFGTINRVCVVGCDTRQNPAAQRQDTALSDNNGRDSNVAGKVNRPAHGPLRIAGSEDCVVSRNLMFSRGSWFAVAGGGDQPCARMAQGSLPNQSLAACENTWIGGSTIFGMDTPNDNIPYDVQREMVVAHNFIEANDKTENVGIPIYSHTFRSNIVYLPADQSSTDGSDLRLFQTLTAPDQGRWCPPEAAPPTPDVYGNTFWFAGGRSNRSLTLGGPRILQRAGIAGQRGDAATAGGGSTVTITGDSASNPGWSYNSAWRVFTDAGAGWVAVADTLAQAAARYTVTELKNANRLQIDFAAGFAPPSGASVVIAWNPSYSPAVYPARAGEFYENGLAEALFRAAPRSADNLLVIDGAFASLTDFDGVTMLDPAGYRLNTIGETDRMLRPLASNMTLARRSGPRRGYRDFGGAATAEPAFVGATQPTTPLRSDFAAFLPEPVAFAPTWFESREAEGSGTYASLRLIDGVASSQQGMLAARFRLRPKSGVTERFFYSAALELVTFNGEDLYWKAGKSGGTINAGRTMWTPGEDNDLSVIIAWDYVGDGSKLGAVGRRSTLWINGAHYTPQTADQTATAFTNLSLCGLSPTIAPAEMGVRSWVWLATDAAPDLATAAAAFFDADDGYEVRDLGATGVVDGVTPEVYLLGLDAFNTGANLGGGAPARPQGSAWRIG